VCKKSKNVRAFSKTALEKCIFSIRARKRFNVAYGNISLSTDAAKSLGYHVSCYKKITALKASWRIETRENVSI